MKRYKIVQRFILLLLYGLVSAGTALAQTNWGSETISSNTTKSFNGGTVNLNGTITVNNGATLTINNSSTTGKLTIKRNFDGGAGTDGTTQMFRVINGGKIVINESETTQVIIDGNGNAGMCFTVQGGELNLKYATIQKMKPNSTTPLSGVAINVYGNSSTNPVSTVTLNHVTIDDCGDAKPTQESAIGSGKTNAAIVTNTWAVAHVTMNDCNITNNRSTSSYGGVVKNGGPTAVCVLEMNRCYVAYNYSSGWGGFLLMSAGNQDHPTPTYPQSKAIIKNCTFEYNEAAYLGGAISNESTVELQNNIFRYNHAAAGGAISTFPFSLTTGDVTEVCGLILQGGNQFYNNYSSMADADFHPVFITSGGNVNKRWPVGGGAIWCYMDLANATCNMTILNETFHDNYTQTGREGGAVYVKALDNVPVANTTLIIGNTSGVGPDIYNNRASYGGGVALINANLTFNAGSVRDNGYNGSTVSTTNGGGIYVNGGAPTMNGGTISGNKATTYGGGLYTTGNGTITANGITISNNTAGTGGGIYTTNASLTNFNMSNGSITGNSATSGNGGGVCLADNTTLTLTGTANITNNTASGNGGGVYFSANSYVKVGSGDLEVSGNTGNGTPNNVYLLQDKTIDILQNANFDPVYLGVYTANRTPNIPVLTAYVATQLETIYNGMVAGTMNIMDDSQTFGPYWPGSTTLYFGDSPWSALQQTVKKNYDLVDSDNDSVYEIGNVKQLTAFLWYVNGIDRHDSNFSTAHPTAKGKLTANISMQNHYWVPIANYRGTFDGNGYIISHIDMLSSNVSAERGLFGVNSSGTIKNVNLHDCSFASGGSYIGSIVSQMNGGTLYNSVAQCQLGATAATTIAGGLVGHINGGTVHSSVSTCEMTGYTMGGLAGKITSGNLYNSFANPQFHYSGPNGSTNYFVGGLVAVNNTGQVENCYVRLGRTQSLGSAMFGMLAGSNSGTNTIVKCYAPDGASSQFNHSYTYLYNNANTGLSNCDLYKKVDAPYLYSRPNDNLVGSTGKTLTEKLNNWVPSNSDYAFWKRTTAGGYSYTYNDGVANITVTGGNINDDYPIHKMKDLACAASPDGLFIHYKASLNRMVSDYNTSGPGTIWLYASPKTAAGADEVVSEANDADVLLYIDEDATLLQADNNTLTAYTSQTLSVGSESRWHFISSSLSNSDIGFNYGTTSQVQFSWAQNPCNVTFSGNNDDALFPGDLTVSDIAKVDLYAFYEPEYHWLNMKRNTNSHWHLNATTVPIVYNGNGTGSNGNETYLVPGKGYLASIDKEQLLQNKGVLNNGSGTVTVQDVTYNTANAWAGLLGYNLLGNPYQSYLDFNAFITDAANSGLNASKANVQPTYAVYDPEIGAYIQFKTGSSKGSRSADGMLHPHQGFLIRRTGGSYNASATFKNTMRSTNSTSPFRGEQPAFPLVNFTVTDNEGNNDVAVLELGRDNDEGAEKLRANTCKGWLYLHHDDNDYAILFRSVVDDYQPLWFEASEAGTYTLAWETANAEFESLTLIDNITGVTTDMLNRSSYVFEANPDQYASRFKIVVGDYKDIDENETPEPAERPAFAFMMGNELVVNGEGRLDVVDMLGRIVRTEELHGSQSSVTMPQSAGMYVLRLTGDGMTRVQKIVVKQ